MEVDGRCVMDNLAESALARLTELLGIAALVVGPDAQLAFVSARARALLDDGTERSSDERRARLEQRLAERGLRLESIALPAAVPGAYLVVIKERGRLDIIDRCILDKGRLRDLPDLASMLAHELAGPLHKLSLAAELLARGGPDDGEASTPDRAQQLQALRSETTRIREQLQALRGRFDMPRFEMPIASSAYEPAEVLGTVRRRFATRAAARGVQLGWVGGRPPEPGAAQAVGNAALMTLALAGICRSLLEHSERGAQLLLGLRRGSDRAVLSFEAPGADLPLERLASLGEPGLMVLARAGSRCEPGGQSEDPTPWAAARLIIEEQGGELLLPETSAGRTVELHLPLSATPAAGG